MSLGCLIMFLLVVEEGQGQGKMFVTNPVSCILSYAKVR